MAFITFMATGIGRFARPVEGLARIAAGRRRLRAASIFDAWLFAPLFRRLRQVREHRAAAGAAYAA